ncbi:MAG: 16S rRNA (cytosine(1402)-N(4))-methyltransferase RsmH [Candidatus Uhrbacteria bacterium]|nr:16S rRNA (cytosine(1402)-N(4))-methyltransferase RsmH [Patescibacteria group bacterium]MBU1906804.1 16S rRNA (cytosine(1402)-N(4))-methyltransferase RsmH [Patescibacteria group bacterium]
MSEYTHIPVLLEETLEYLDPKPDQDFIDGTFGLGGHAGAILARTAPKGRLLGIDKDENNLDRGLERLKGYGKRLTLAHDSFKNIKSQAYDHGFYPVDGIVLDLGFSSVHIEDASRGFSFRAEGPLDMRYDQTQALTAEQIVNEWSQEDLAKIFRQLGEERNALKIAAAIVQERQREPVATTTALAKIILSAVPNRGKHERIHPATRAFQALRIAVNHELEDLEVVLPIALDVLKPGGRLVVISFHSLEDRIVKQFFKSHQGTDLEILTKKVVKPSREEILANPRSRSAKLRAARKL